MYRTILIIAVLSFAVIVSQQVFADTTIQRDAVYASEDKPHGNGVSRDGNIKDAAEVKQQIISQLNNDANITTHMGIEETCAWNHIEFREAYLSAMHLHILWLDQFSPEDERLPYLKQRYAFLNNLIDTGEKKYSPLVIQQDHTFSSGDDSSVYQVQNISPYKEKVLPVTNNECMWIKENLNNNRAEQGLEKIYSDDYAVVFPEDYSVYDQEGEFQCTQPIVLFCNKNMIVSGDMAFFGFGENVENEKYGDAQIFFVNSENEGHVFEGNQAFWSFYGNVTIGDGNHTFYGYNNFYSDGGNITIGDGNHTFHGDNNFSGSGNVTIGDGNHTFYGDYIFNGVYDGNITIGDGDLKFLGWAAFNDSNCNVKIGNGSVYFFEEAFKFFEGTITMGDGEHIFDYETFCASKYIMYLGNGKHIFYEPCGYINSVSVIYIAGGIVVDYTGVRNTIICDNCEIR